METKKIKINSLYDLTSIVRTTQDPKALILLTHGYCQRGSFIFNKLINFLPKWAEVHSPTAPFPLLSGHPLEKRDKKKKLIIGNAWYFYDAAKNMFHINYDIPIKLLNNYLELNNPKNLPVIAIGYSQGGYLLPFLALKNHKVDHIIGLNCSYRVDLINKPINCKADAINGEDDNMVDPYLAYERQKELFGEFVLLKNENHYLTNRFGLEVDRLLKQSPCLD